jgi:hypothetical protein
VYVRLAPSDRLTFVSDRVADARIHSGEPFGFERNTAVTRGFAEPIAKAAQDFGQEDDSASNVAGHVS